MSRRPPRPPGTDYEVGYAKPPIATRFRKGISGNPRGRPRRFDSFESIVAKVLGEKVSLRHSTGIRKVAVLEAVVRSIAHAAAVNRDPRAMKQVVELARALPDYTLPVVRDREPGTSALEILRERLDAIRQRLPVDSDDDGGPVG